jgi:hypothetical protein
MQSFDSKVQSLELHFCEVLETKDSTPELWLHAFIAASPSKLVSIIYPIWRL